MNDIKTKNRSMKSSNGNCSLDRAATLQMGWFSKLIHSITLFSSGQEPMERRMIPMWIFCKEYTNRWGKRMIASDYGYSAWHFWVPCKRKKK